MHYKDLSPELKQTFDRLHQAILQHRQTMSNLQTVEPNLEGIERLKPKIHQVSEASRDLRKKATELQERAQRDVVDVTVYAKWPLEALASRKNIQIKTTTNNKVDSAISDALNQSLSLVHSVAQMPSPLYWKILQRLEGESHNVHQRTQCLLSQQQRLDLINSDDQLQRYIQEQLETQQLQVNALSTAKTCDVSRLKSLYARYETGENVLEKNTLELMQQQKHQLSIAQQHYLKAAADVQKQPAASQSFAPVAAPSTLPPSTAPSTGFSSTLAPSTGFSSTLAPSTSFTSSSTRKKGSASRSGKGRR